MQEIFNLFQQHRKALDLWAASFLVLFLELTCIRWTTAQIRMAAYFPNILMVGCFFGFGVGCMLKERRTLLPGLPALILFYVALCAVTGPAGLGDIQSRNEFVWSSVGRSSWLWLLPLLYLTLTGIFACLGQMISQLFDAFRPLEAYSINVVGSLWGSIAFALMAYLGATPTWWFLMTAAVLLWLVGNSRKRILAGAVVLGMAVGWVYHEQKSFLWSPYYKIQIQLKASLLASRSFYLTVNNIYHQATFNLSDQAVRESAELKPWRDTYDFPYRLMTAAPEDILVLGCGTGNDVAAAIRGSRARIDAVELDPLILWLGRQFHPESPLSNPRVSVHANDARFFLRQHQTPYDAIVLGWLDSHRIFSSFSNVRQDNFVYTVESMRSARSLLKPDGLLFVSFAVGKRWVAEKLYAMLSDAFGHAPRVYVYLHGAYGDGGHIFVIGRTPNTGMKDRVDGFKEITDTFQAPFTGSIPTDDWPFLYYQDHKISPEYASILIILALLSGGIVRAVMPRTRNHSWDCRLGVFFLLGLGFMLLETRNVTALALVFGSTWIVTSVVIGLVLVMVLAANGLVEKGLAPNLPTTWGLLFATLALSLVLKEPQFPGGPVCRAVLMSLLVSSTFLFSSLIFARLFSRTSDPGVALGINTMGAALGGLLEYATLIIGLKGLLWLGIFIYLAAWLLSFRTFADAQGFGPPGGFPAPKR